MSHEESCATKFHAIVNDFTSFIGEERSSFLRADYFSKIP